MGVYIGTSELKNAYIGERNPFMDYQEVEYIQSSGTQYINTGFIPTNNTKIELSMGGLNNAGSNCVLFGARASWSTTASTGRGLQLSVNGLTADYGGMFGRRYNSGDGFSGFSWLNGGDYILEVSQSGFYENGVNKFTPQTVTFTSPVSLHIFNLNNNGATEGNSSYKMYYCKIYESGTLVRDFIPCYRKSDNVIGLFDKVENKFYTNAGSGTFIKGNDVRVLQPELKNAYIGKVIECDFTQSDCGFTFAQKFNYCTYGRNSNGLYCTATGGYYNQAAAWKVPSNIYNQQIKKATFELSGTGTNNGGGFAVGIDTKTIRHFNSLRIIRGTQNSTGTSESSPANTKWTFTIDFVNKVASSSLSSSTLSITDNAISAFNTDWSAGNVNIVSITGPTHNSTSYLSKVIFEY